MSRLVNFLLRMWIWSTDESTPPSYLAIPCTAPSSVARTKAVFGQQASGTERARGRPGFVGNEKEEK